MPFNIPAGTQRITSKDLVVVFQPIGHADFISENALPVYGVDQNCIAEITQSGVNTDTWKLRVNGYITAALAGDITSTALATAIDALPNMATGDILVTGVAVAGAGTHVLTAAADALNTYILYEVQEESVAGTAVLAYTQFGSSDVIISTDISNFNFAENQETTDATAIAERSRIKLPTVRDMNFDFMVYEAKQTWRHLIKPGMAGYITVYNQGIGSGLPVYAFEALLSDVNVNAEQFEKIENEVSGTRQGDWIIQPGSYQP